MPVHYHAVGGKAENVCKQTLFLSSVTKRVLDIQWISIRYAV